MAITVHPARERDPSFGEKLSAGIGRGLEMGTGMFQQHQQKQAQAEQGQKISQLIGMDVSGLDPEMQKVALQLSLQGKNQQLVEMLKGQRPLNPLQEAQKQLAEARTKQAEGKRELFQNLLGGGQPQDIGQQLVGQGSQQSLELPQAQQGQFDIRNPQSWSDDQVRKVAGFAGQPGEEGVIGNIAKQELERRKDIQRQEKETFEKERTYQSGFSKELEQENNKLRNSIPRKEMALNFARDAVETGNLSFLSPDKIADATGIDLFRTSKGAQLITAGKENLLSNMSRASARAQNLWFEQRLNSMFPRIGQSREANLTTQEMLEGELALDKAYVDEFDRISDEDEKNFGFVRKDIGKRVSQALKPLEKHILNRTSYRMKEIEESEKGLSSMKAQVGKNVANGTPLTLAMAKLYKEKFGENALKVAEKNGYRIPTLEEFKSYQERPQEFREEME